VDRVAQASSSDTKQRLEQLPQQAAAAQSSHLSPSSSADVISPASAHLQQPAPSRAQPSQTTAGKTRYIVVSVRYTLSQ